MTMHGEGQSVDMAKAHPEVRRALIDALDAVGDGERAVGQQRYMKSDMPFHGVTMRQVRQTTNALMREYPIDNIDAWLATILELWRCADKREQRYAAIELLTHRRYQSWLSSKSVDTIEELVVTGAWWDFIDAIAARAMGTMLRNHPVSARRTLRAWSTDANFWKRRTAILAQLKARDDTDAELLFELIEPSLGDDEFFVRKAIGWALRTYSRVDPAGVMGYVKTNAHRLSALSKREALKILLKRGIVTQVP